jgi:hemolysin III
MPRGERFNSISHLVGAVLALVGATVLITVAAMEGGAMRVVSFAVYGAAMVILFLMSTLYHSFSGRAKRWFRMFDHHSIYLMIAGTYTPFALVGIRGSTGWWLFGLVWGLALLGILLDCFPRNRPRILPVTLYLVMGWLCLFSLEPMLEALSTAAFGWLLAGGIVYTAGVIFYILDHWLPWCHEIWHLFVIGGSACHYCSVWML